MLSKLKIFKVIFSIAVLFSAVESFAKHPVKFLNLYVGVYHDERLPLAPRKVTRAGTFRKYVKAQYFGASRKLRLYPRKEGSSTLIVKDTAGSILYEYRIEVRKTSLSKIAREIRSLTSDIDGIQIKVLNNKVIVDGQILLPRDMGRIHTVVKQYGDLAASLVRLSPLAQRKIAQLIERDINNPEVRVRAVNGKFILEGQVGGKLDRDRAEIVAKAYVPDVVVDEAVADKKVLERKTDVVINLITIKEAGAPAPKKIIQLVVHYVELSKNYSKGFRFQWTPDIGDGSSVTFNSGAGRGTSSVVATLTGTISNLLPKLNWAKEHGHARVLQSTSMIVEDTQKGTLKSQTNIPYQGVAENGTLTTKFESTGIVTEITPRVIGSRSDSIKLKMMFQIKALLGTTPQGPLISNREIRSVLVIRSGQSAAVGGLISNQKFTNYNKLPANASANPIISLFASKSFSREQSQFVVFVTPIIKSSASSGARQIRRKFRIQD